MRNSITFLITLLLLFQVSFVIGNEQPDFEIRIDSITVSQPTSSATWDASDTSPKSISWSTTMNGVDVYLYKGKGVNSRMVQSFGYARKGATGMSVVLSTALSVGNDYSIFVEEWFGGYEIGWSDYFSIIKGGGDSNEDGKSNNNPSSTNLVIAGNTIYLADVIDDLFIYEVVDPSAPELAKNVEIEGVIEDMFVRGDMLYLSISQPVGSKESFYGLAMLNISDPLNPTDPVYANTNGKAFGLYISGNYAYLMITYGYDEFEVSHDYNNLAIIDISDSNNPGTPIYREMGEIVSKVWVKGNYAYMPINEFGLGILDISDPLNLPDTNFIDIENLGESLFVDSNNRLFITSNDGIYVIDITDPLNPGTPYLTSVDESNPKVSGNLMFTQRLGNVNMYDITDIANIASLTYKSVAGIVFDHEVVGDYLFVADYGGGLKTFYIGDAIPTIEDIISGTTSPDNETGESPLPFNNILIEVSALFITSLIIYDKSRRRHL